MARLSPLQRIFQEPVVLAVYERARESPLAWPLSGRTLRQEVREVVAAIDAAAACSPPAVLDLACGQGTFSFAVARLRPTLDIVGLDLSPGQLDRARRRALRGTTSNVTFTRGDATRMPFGDRSFRAVFSITSLHQIPDQAAVVCELARVCAPGAAFFAACLASRGAVWELRRRVQDALGFHLLQGQDWVRMLEAAGFEDATYRQRTPLWGVLSARRRA